MTEQNEKVYYLTPEGRDRAFLLLSGEATPSDLNIELEQAAIILTLLSYQLESKLKALSENALNLAHMYADAAKVIK